MLIAELDMMVSSIKKKKKSISRETRANSPVHPHSAREASSPTTAGAHKSFFTSLPVANTTGCNSAATTPSLGPIAASAFLDGQNLKLDCDGGMQQDAQNVEDEGRGGGWMSYLLRFALEESDDDDDDAQGGGGVENKSESGVWAFVLSVLCMYV